MAEENGCGGWEGRWFSFDALCMCYSIGKEFFGIPCIPKYLHSGSDTTLVYIPIEDPEYWGGFDTPAYVGG